MSTGISTSIDYSTLFSSLPSVSSSSSGISGLASLASEYKNISTGAYRTLANAYVKKMQSSSSSSKSTDTDTDTDSTTLDAKSMTSEERLAAAREAAEKASNETFKQTYGSDGTLSGNTGYSSLFSIDA